MDSLSDQHLHLINLAIRRLMEDRKSGHDQDPSVGPEPDGDHLLLSELLSQLESLKGEDSAMDNPPEESKNTSSGAGTAAVSTEDSGEEPGGVKPVERQEIVKELRRVRRQNTVTHWLLSIMIVLTLSWQVSEVSLMLKLKDGLSHPFRSIGSMLAGMFKGGRGRACGPDEESPVPNPSEMLPIPQMNVSELTDLGSNGEGKD